MKNIDFSGNRNNYKKFLIKIIRKKSSDIYSLIKSRINKNSEKKHKCKKKLSDFSFPIFPI